MEQPIPRTSPSDMTLREIVPGDLPIFFEHQLDPDAIYMAAFTAADPSNRPAFEAHWAKILANDAITKRTIVWGDMVIGNIASFPQECDLEITYWIDKAYWGKGLATAALALFLQTTRIRPVFGRAVKDNHASIRVLQKCGFVICGEDRGFAQGRGAEVDELILRLD